MPLRVPRALVSSGSFVSEQNQVASADTFLDRPRRRREAAHPSCSSVLSHLTPRALRDRPDRQTVAVFKIVHVATQDGDFRLHTLDYGEFRKEILIGTPLHLGCLGHYSPWPSPLWKVPPPQQARPGASRAPLASTDSSVGWLCTWWDALTRSVKSSLE